MKLNLSARHFEASDRLQKFALKKVERLERFAGRDIDVDLVLEENSSLKRAEIRLNYFGKLLQASAEGVDFFKIIPVVVSKIEKQVKSTKEKVYSK